MNAGTAATAAKIELSLAGQQVCLLAGGALFWPAQAALFIADPHFGKSAAFRRFGIAAPDVIGADLERLDSLLVSTGAQRLVVLGDFYHARHGLSQSTLSSLRAWREERRTLEIVIVRGNHDRGAGDPPSEWRMQCVAEPWRCGVFVCCHIPCENRDGYVLSGHVHPGFALRDRSGAGLRAACFVIGARRAILPSFGSFTGMALHEPAPDEDIFLIKEDAIVKARSRDRAAVSHKVETSSAAATLGK